MASPTPNRPSIIGDPSGPSDPYPLHMSGRVISGFGRGSKELGIPTANLPVDDTQTPWISSTPSGVYFGWASIRLPPSHPDSPPPPPPPPSQNEATPTPTTLLPTNGFTVYPMVMSIGYNPFYKNTVRSAEVHVLHKFHADFYGAEMRLLIAGYVRKELDYSGLEALIADINFDCVVARRSLARDGWAPRGVEVAVEIDGEVDGVAAGEGEEKAVKVLRDGKLEADWLIRPSELGGEVEDAEGK
ncbi:riboflavin kinase [Chaetomium sp. MPI-SDFR-AT-0129]|nr:riboflavin kinase [Chaetomium sp. MPI-SDFR-AT-0129]